jgi:hypothetical protein
MRMSGDGRSKSGVSNTLAILATSGVVVLIVAIAFFGGVFSINYGILSSDGPGGTSTISSSSQTGNSSTTIITLTITRTVKSTKTVYSITNGSSVQIASMTLLSGTTSNASQAATAFLQVTFSDSGSSTYITSITLTGRGLAKSITCWDNSSAVQSRKNLIVFTYGHPGNNAIVGSGANTTLGFYPTTKSNPVESIAKASTYNYVIDFADGETLSGQITAE